MNKIRVQILKNVPCTSKHKHIFVVKSHNTDTNASLPAKGKKTLQSPLQAIMGSCKILRR